MYKIGVNPKNYIFENTILSIDLARNAANKSKSGKFAKVLSLSNPGAKMVAQLQNAVGKESIAKYANGIKGFASLTGYYLGQLDDADSKFEDSMESLELPLDSSEITISERISDLKENYKKALSEYGINPNSLRSYLEVYNTIDSKIFINNDDKGLDNLDPDSKKRASIILAKYHRLLNIERTLFPKSYKHFGNTPVIFPNLNIDPIKNTKNPYLKRLMEENDNYGLQEDVFATLGVMLNISTDNAKELVLEKINAAGDLARIYIYMIATGNKFSDITNFMTKDIITFISNKSKRSVFKEEDEFTSLDSAIDYFLKGVNTNNYFEKDYKKNIFNELLKLVQDSKYKKLLEKTFIFGII